MIVGCRVVSTTKTDSGLEANEMTIWFSGKHLPRLRCHSDAGSQFTSNHHGEPLTQTGAVPSIGTIGASFHNSLAETVNGNYKAEIVRGPEHLGPRKKLEERKLVTTGWVTCITRNASTVSSATSHPQSLKTPSTPNRVRQKPWQKPQLRGLDKTQYG